MQRDPLESSTDSLTGAVSEAADRARNVVRLEAELAVAELTAKARRVQAGIVLLGAAAGLAVFGAAVAIAALAALIALFLPWWAALMIVAGGLLAGAVVAGVIGVRIVRSGARLVPEAAISEARRTMSELSRVK